MSPRRSASATSPSPAPGTCCCARAAGGATARRSAAPRRCWPPCGRRARAARGRSSHWAEAPADDATNPALEEWPVGQWPADPLTSGRRRALTAAADLVTAAVPHPLDPELVLDGGDPQLEQWVRDADLLLRERARHASPTVDVPLPSHLSVSALVTLRRDPAELARRLRRPMPAAPAPQARRGTAFHAWLEERFGAAKLVDLDELPGSGDEFAAPDGALADLQQAFLASEWADRQPAEVEVPFETPLGPLTLRGRIDAVYADGEGSYEVIDWKTGPPPSGAELAAAGVQLAAYRLGWSRLTGVPVERVSAGFHHVAAKETLRPWREGVPPRRGQGDLAPRRPARRGRPARAGHRHRLGRSAPSGQRGTAPSSGCMALRPSARGVIGGVLEHGHRLAEPELAHVGAAVRALSSRHGCEASNNSTRTAGRGCSIRSHTPATWPLDEHGEGGVAAGVEDESAQRGVEEPVPVAVAHEERVQHGQQRDRPRLRWPLGGGSGQVVGGHHEVLGCTGDADRDERCRTESASAGRTSREGEPRPPRDVVHADRAVRRDVALDELLDGGGRRDGGQVEVGEHVGETAVPEGAAPPGARSVGRGGPAPPGRASRSPPPVLRGRPAAHVVRPRSRSCRRARRGRRVPTARSPPAPGRASDGPGWPSPCARRRTAPVRAPGARRTPFRACM